MKNCEIHFSPREQEVLCLIGQFYNYEKIRVAMKISRKTLYKYIESISDKLNLKTEVGKRVQQDIIKYAVENGYGKEQHVAL